MDDRISTQTATNELAKRIRLDCLDMTSKGGGSHIGSAFSIADIMAVLYGKVLRFDPKNPRMENRDRFILSKGHAGVAVYSALSLAGFFSRERLNSYYENGSSLSGHVSHKGVPGVELSTGSLGHGLSVGVGMAYAAKLQGKNFRVFVLLSDGECDEGSNWEAILFAAHHKLDNLVAIVDYNKLQSLTTIDKTMRLEPFSDKWQAFGWKVQESDGHSHPDLLSTLSRLPFEKGRPNCLLAHTVKGKGVSFMENQVLWHYRIARDEEYAKARKELELA